MLSTIAEIIRDLLIFIGVIAALLIALIVVVSKMPNTNPLKRVLTAQGSTCSMTLEFPLSFSGIGTRFSGMLVA
jgi:hypothetical protein